MPISRNKTTAQFHIPIGSRDKVLTHSSAERSPLRSPVIGSRIGAFGKSATPAARIVEQKSKKVVTSRNAEESKEWGLTELDDSFQRQSKREHLNLLNSKKQSSSQTTFATSSHNSDKENIKVIIRIRPLSELEKEDPENSSEIWGIKPGGLHNVKKKRIYRFDHVHESSSRTVNIFDEHLETYIWKTMEGYNSSIFCYGQTGSGKTYTMYGAGKENKGIVHLAVDTIFSFIEATPNREYLLRVSFIEIYNESVNDLLNEQNLNLQIRDNVKGGISVKNLTECICTKVDQVKDIINKGERTRKIGVTNINEKSSRSHTILRLTIESRERSQDCVQPSESFESGPKESVLGYSSTLNLIDLAGSECATSIIDVSSHTKVEMSCINKSLLTLSIVIQRLSEKNHNSHWIPYRDSKLTRYMQSALEGNSKIAIICTISPSLSCYEESMSTLCFAMRARNITQQVQRNEIVDSEKALIYYYEKQIKQLMCKVKEMESLIQTPKLPDKPPTQLSESEAALYKKIEELDARLSQVTEEKVVLLEEIDRLRSLILVAGQEPATSGASEMDESIYLRCERIKEERSKAFQKIAKESSVVEREKSKTEVPQIVISEAKIDDKKYDQSIKKIRKSYTAQISHRTSIVEDPRDIKTVISESESKLRELRAQANEMEIMKKKLLEENGMLKEEIGYRQTEINKTNEIISCYKKRFGKI